MDKHSSFPSFRHSTFTIPLPATVLVAAFTLILLGCEPPEKMRPNDDVKSYVDYVPASKQLLGQNSTQVQHTLGSPDHVARVSDDEVNWLYDRRFCEADARWIYKTMVLHFERQKLVSMQPATEH